MMSMLSETRQTVQTGGRSPYRDPPLMPTALAAAIERYAALRVALGTMRLSARGRLEAEAAERAAAVRVLDLAAEWAQRGGAR